jgi:phospholipid/cholesterol/gamma-HCH transport system substrate-binding protein
MSRLARLGAFIVGTLAILAVGIFVIGSKEYLFRSTYQLKTQFANVAGLAEGADVQVGGVHSGTVHSIALPHTPGGQVTVVMDLDRSTQEIIKRDSVASIATEGVLGNQFVAISFGTQGQAEVKDGDTILSEPPLLLADLLTKANGILDSSQQAIQNTTQATAHLNTISAKIDSGQGTVGALVNDRQMYDDLQRTTTGLGATVLEAQAGVTDFRENMEALKHNFFLSGYFKKRGYEDSSELAANRIAALPQGVPEKTFTLDAKKLFDGRDSAKMKDPNSLKDAGAYLAQTQFGVAVVVVASGTQGDSQKELTLTEARAMVIREYLVENFGFDDTELRTLGMGKQTGAKSDADWGSVEIIIYPAGTEQTATEVPLAAKSPSPKADNPVQATVASPQP